MSDMAEVLMDHRARRSTRYGFLVCACGMWNSEQPDRVLFESHLAAVLAAAGFGLVTAPA